MRRSFNPVVAIDLPSGERLAGDYWPGEGDFAVVWVHGFGSHRGGEKSTAMQLACVERGWPFLAVDLCGHGESPGTMLELTATRLLEDLAAARRFLADRDHTRLGLVGSSLGGFAAAWFAQRHPEAVVGCVLIAPAFGFLERRWTSLGEAERDEWRRTGRQRVVNEWVDVEIGYGLVAEREEFSIRRLTSGWSKPALLFHGTDDEIVPVADSQEFVRAVNCPEVELRLLSGGDHRLLPFKNEMAVAASQFFQRLLDRDKIHSFP